MSPSLHNIRPFFVVLVHLTEAHDEKIEDDDVDRDE